MFKRILAAVFALVAASAFAAVDVNKATQAELEAVKGIGPSIATKIVDERKKGNFKDWNDMVERVKGVGDGNAAKFSAEGLTVNGSGFKGAAAKPAAEAKPAAKAADAKAADAKPAAKAAEAKPADAAKATDKPTAADKAKEKADKKAAKKAEKAEKADKAASAAKK